MRRWQVWVTVSVVLLGLLIWRTRPWDALALGADWRALAIAVVLNLVVIVAWAFRSQRLMASVGHPLSITALIPLVSFANTVNNLTPASAGEAARALLLQRRHGVPYGPSTAVIAVERLWAIWIMALTAAAAALGTVFAAGPIVIAAGWVAAAAGVIAPVIATRVGLRPAGWLAGLVDPDGRRGGRRGRLAALLRSTDAHLATILSSPGVALSFLATTGLIFVTTATQLWLVVASLGDSISLVAAWAALGLATVAGVLSALPFGLGAADVVLAGLLVVLGVPAADAGAATLLVRATVTLPLGLAGTASWIAMSRGTDSAAAPPLET
jgi:glycosyltransferase 2 family protein